MKRNAYGKKVVSRLGFGAWPLGNEAYGNTMSEEEGIELVRHALKEGINFFDTAPNYALGRSEEILGKALKGYRDKVVINSKFGHHPDDTIDFSPSIIEASVKASLKRLNTDYLDSVILHNPPREVLLGQTTHFDVLKKLKRAGLIRAYGVSVDAKEECELALKIEGLSVIELLFNIFSQESRDLLNNPVYRDVSFIIKVPLDSGWLTGAYSKDKEFTGVKGRWTDEVKARRAELVENLKNTLNTDELVKESLGFIWSHKNVTTVIPGMRTISQCNAHLEAERYDYNPQNKGLMYDFYDTHIEDDPLPW